MFKVPLSAPIRKVPGRTEFQRGILSADERRLHRAHHRRPGSGILSSMSQANCFIVLGSDVGNVAAGEMVDVQLLED
jgi:molybdopterin molybdotransferase